jgi:hypothetical protein
VTGAFQMDTESGDACKNYLSVLAQMNHVPSSFILSLGRGWLSQTLPPDVSMGPQRQCYQNAGLLALERSELTYVEGYACPVDGIPVNHAWCVDEKGCVVDNTFVRPDLADYYGVPVSRGALQSLVADLGHWGLFAEHMTPDLLMACLNDVQAGAWPADATAAESVRQMLDAFMPE